MKHFKTFFKTTVGRKPQSESGSEKRADAATSVMKSAFGSKSDAAPAPAPADVSSGGLGAEISASAGRAAGG